MTSFIEAQRSTYGVEPICADLPIAPSTYYAARSRPPSAHAGPKRKEIANHEIKRRAQQALEAVEMVETAQLPAGHQIAWLSRALVKPPTVLLLDEPLRALDAKLHGAMRREPKRMRSDVGITFVEVTHDQERS